MLERSNLLWLYKKTFFKMSPFVLHRRKEVIEHEDEKAIFFIFQLFLWVCVLLLLENLISEVSSDLRCLISCIIRFNVIDWIFQAATACSEEGLFQLQFWTWSSSELHGLHGLRPPPVLLAPDASPTNGPILIPTSKTGIERFIMRKKMLSF